MLLSGLVRCFVLSRESRFLWFLVLMLCPAITARTSCSVVFFLISVRHQSFFHKLWGALLNYTCSTRAALAFHSLLCVDLEHYSLVHYTLARFRHFVHSLLWSQVFASSHLPAMCFERTLWVSLTLYRTSGTWGWPEKSLGHLSSISMHFFIGAFL